jgi:ribulose-phosphate 3-epimerase
MSEQHLKVSASLWSADLGDLRAQMAGVEQYCESFHFDVMDGHYVPYLLFGPDQVRSLRPRSSKPFEIHLMVDHPDQMLGLFLDLGDVFILHRKTCRNWDHLKARVKGSGKRLGLALEVDEDWREIQSDLPTLDLVLVMGTMIGVKGASIHPGTYAVIRQLKDYSGARGIDVTVQADGGIREDTVPLLHKAGADVVTAGSLLFGQDYARFYAWIQSI